VLSLGGAGGPTIITQVVLVMVYHLDLGLPLREAVAAPRIHHQWKPDVLSVERALDESIVAELAKRGHRVERTSRIGVTQAIAAPGPGETLTGVSDLRR
jgi:gamma-glutamyltranspeptidase/glutathione hydrolase